MTPGPGNDGSRTELGRCLGPIDSEIFCFDRACSTLKTRNRASLVGSQSFLTISLSYNFTNVKSHAIWHFVENQNISSTWPHLLFYIQDQSIVEMSNLYSNHDQNSLSKCSLNPNLKIYHWLLCILWLDNGPWDLLVVQYALV